MKLKKIFAILSLFSMLITAFPGGVLAATSSSWTQSTDVAFNYGTKANLTVSSGAKLVNSRSTPLLSGTNIVDSNYYEPETTSTKAVAGTSVFYDANWVNGISKLSVQIGSSAADPTVNPSSNIVVSGTATDPSTKLRIKITTAGAVGISAYQYSTDDGSTWSGADITTSTSITQIASTGVYLSFTESTSFTASDVFKIASWYTETLNTSTRGSAKAFPTKVILAATATTVDIYDSKDNTLWMRFNTNGGTYSASNLLYRSSTAIPSSVFALNGKMYVGTAKTSGSGVGSLDVIDFVNDGGRYLKELSEGAVWPSNILNRNTVQAFVYGGYYNLISRDVNDVHATVISGKTYVAVATDGGVSVINETDGTVVNSSAAVAMKRVFIGGSRLYVGRSAGDNLYYSTAPVASLGASFSLSMYTSATTPASVPVSYGSGITELYVTSGTSAVDGISNTIYFGTNLGLTVIQEKQGDESNGSVKYYTKDYITEEMIGDIRGMWPMYETTTTDANQFKASGYLDTGKLGQAVSMYGNAAGTAGSKLTFNRGAQISGNNYEHINTNQGTISFWFKSPTAIGSIVYDQYLFDFGDAAGNRMALYMDASEDDLTLNINGTEVSSAGITFAANTFYLITFTYTFALATENPGFSRE